MSSKVMIRFATAFLSTCLGRGVFAQPPAGQPPPGQPPAAQAPAGATAWQKACVEDVKKLCAEPAKAGGNVLECLASKENDLSQECKDSFLWKYKVAQLCREDFDKFCKPPLAEGMTRGQCIKEHEKDLSEKCRKALVQGNKRFKTEEKAQEKIEAAAAGKPAEASPSEGQAPAKPAAKAKKASRAKKKS